MRSLLGSHAFLAGSSIVASTALSQDYTRVDVEYSFDNVNWNSGSVTTTSAAQPIYFRVKFTHTGPSQVFGLADVSYQPLFTRGDSSFPISLVPLALTSPAGAGVTANTGVPANLGRLTPFAANPMNDGSGPGLLTTFSGVYRGEGVLRYSGSRAEVPDQNLAWGVRSSQLPPGIAGTNFNASSNAIVFRCAASIQGTITPVLYFVDVPYSLIGTDRDPSVVWYTSNTGSGLPKRILVDPANVNPVFVWLSGNPCIQGFSGAFIRSPKDATVIAGRRAAFTAEVVDCGIQGLQWTRNGVPLSNNARIQGATSRKLVIDDISAADAGTYTLTMTLPDGPQQRSATLAVTCPADLDNGSGTGTPDNAITIDDLLFFLAAFEGGSTAADLDDGQGLSLQDDAVTIDDLLYFLTRFELGC
jgi:hypothetical protein